MNKYVYHNVIDLLCYEHWANKQKYFYAYWLLLIEMTDRY